MVTIVSACGCSITSAAIGPPIVFAVHHCLEHRYLQSQDKTLRQMANEIRSLPYQERASDGGVADTG